MADHLEQQFQLNENLEDFDLENKINKCQKNFKNLKCNTSLEIITITELKNVVKNLNSKRNTCP